MKNNSEILGLMYASAQGQKYNTSSHTCVKEFVPTFEKLQDARLRFKADPVLAKHEWQPNPPYPCIYTPNYRKSILPT
jgi:hypothetical protein